MSLFNKPKRKVQPRKPIEQFEDGEEEDDSLIEDIRELQRSRERKNGLTEIECAVGIVKAAALEDGLQMAGGKMAISGKQKAKLEAAGIEAGIREQFEKETLLRDEHEELRKFIDQGLKGNSDLTSETCEQPDTSGSRENDVLLRAARKLKDYRSETATELLSEHMLAGIPEVDLGLNARISNILETEKKKKELVEAARSGKNPVTETGSEEKPPSKRPRV